MSFCLFSFRERASSPNLQRTQSEAAPNPPSYREATHLHHNNTNAVRQPSLGEEPLPPPPPPIYEDDVDSQQEMLRRERVTMRALKGNVGNVCLFVVVYLSFYRTLYLGSYCPQRTFYCALSSKYDIVLTFRTHLSRI